MKPINFGVAGCSRASEIALLRIARWLPSIRPVAIYSRTLSRAKAWAERFGVERAVERFSDLIVTDDVDIIYIGLPSQLHYEAAMDAVRGGKHCLIEKPMCLRLSEVSALHALARDKGCMVREGLMAQYHPWQTYIRRLVEDCTFGGLQETKTTISFPLTDDRKARRAESGGGIAHDTLPYWLQLLQLLSPGDSMEICSSEACWSKEYRYDTEFAAELRVGKDVRASFFGSFEQPYKAMHLMEFERARVVVPNIFRCTIGMSAFHIIVEPKDGREPRTITFPPQNYYVNQLRIIVEELEQSRCSPDSLVEQRIALLNALLRASKGIACNQELQGN
jgi:dTDP-3,4-didehydro-2,6-dideoxy-alpha-D-glucose 3-reductase